MNEGNKNRFIDLTGNHINTRTVLSFAGMQHKRASWNVRCDCGNEFVCLNQALREATHCQKCQKRKPKDPKKRFLAQVDTSNNCWIWQGARYTNGYGAFQLNGHNTGAHRASYELFIGPIPTGLFVLHKYDNRPCVNPKHLFVGTQKDNMADCKQKGRFIKGTDHAHSRLKPIDVKKIREEYKPRSSNFNLNVLGLKYNISPSSISRIVRKERYV